MQSLSAVQKKQKEVPEIVIVAQSQAMVKRFTNVFGATDKANQFLASIISATNGSEGLSECDPVKIIECAMVAASLNLDVNPNLGLASIVPYKKKVKVGKELVDTTIPQFQMGWKGYVQLAMRSGQYRTMNVTEVYEDEFDGFDPFKGELKYHIVNGGDRDNSRENKIVGYAFYFELTTGYSKMTYMSKEKIEAHALRYSKAYQNDKKYGSKNSPWSTMFKEMACKTIVKLQLSKWGVLSTQMQKARMADEASIENDGKDFNYIDNATNVVTEEEAVTTDVPKEEPKKKAKKEVVAEPTPDVMPQSMEEAEAFVF